MARNVYHIYHNYTCISEVRIFYILFKISCSKMNAFICYKKFRRSDAYLERSSLSLLGNIFIMVAKVYIVQQFLFNLLFLKLI